MPHHAFTPAQACFKFSYWNFQLTCHFQCLYSNNFLAYWISLVSFLVNVFGNKSVKILKFSSFRSLNAFLDGLALLNFSSFFVQRCRNTIQNRLTYYSYFQIHIIASFSHGYVTCRGHPLLNTILYLWIGHYSFNLSDHRCSMVLEYCN